MLLKQIEETFSGLGYIALSAEGSDHLEMIVPECCQMHMFASVSDHAGYGYLTVYDQQDLLLMIRLYPTGPILYPHKMRGEEGYDLLEYLYTFCEPFHQDFLVRYMELEALTMWRSIT